MVTINLQFTTQETPQNYRFTSNVYNLSGAYHIGLGKKGMNIFTIGAQYGTYSRKAGENFIWTSDILGNPSPAYESELMEGRGFSDLAAGVTFTAKSGDTNYFRTGLNFTHLLSGNQSVLRSGGMENKSIGFIAFANMKASMGKRSSFQPALLYQKDGPFSHMEAQVRFGYLFKPEKQITLNYGLGLRPGESIQILLGMDYGQLRAGVSYDLVNGGVRDAGRETFELGVSYIFNIEKQPKRIPVIFCPRL